MPDAIHRLSALAHEFVKIASQELAQGEGLRHTVESELERFFDLLLDGLHHAGASRLDGLLGEWVSLRPSTPAGEQPTSLLAVLNALRRALLLVAQARLSPDEALEVVRAADPIFGAASLRVAALEMDAMLAEVEARLAEVRSHLERLDRSKSDFISVAAHELKTPLTLIEGYSNMLVAEYPADQFPRAQIILRGVANGTRRLKEIIEDMIDVSMIDNNLLSLNFQPVWIGRLLELARGELEPAVRERSQTLILDPFPGADERTFADPERLYQVFMNVLRNAVKYTPDRGTITVSGRLLPGFVEVTIADTGIGIAPEHQQHIFEKFASVGDVALHSSGKTKFKGGGAGLGLPIAKGIVDAHGGTIWCESPGCDETKMPGSTFHVLIPLRDAPPQDHTPKLFGMTSTDLDQIVKLNS